MVNASHSRSPSRDGPGRIWRSTPWMVALAAIGLVVVIGAVWIGFATRSERHPGRPGILNAAGPYVVQGMAPPGRIARPKQ